MKISTIICIHIFSFSFNINYNNSFDIYKTKYPKCENCIYFIPNLQYTKKNDNNKRNRITRNLNIINIYRMVMLTDFNQKIIPDYSPISVKGGRKSRRSRKRYTRKHKKSNKSRTRRRYR